MRYGIYSYRFFVFHIDFLYPDTLFNTFKIEMTTKVMGGMVFETRVKVMDLCGI